MAGATDAGGARAPGTQDTEHPTRDTSERDRWVDLLSNPKRVGKPASFEMSNLWVAVATVAVLLGIMFLAGQSFQPTLQSTVILFHEEPLHKSRELSVSPGEIYHYTHSMGNESMADFTFWVAKGPGCTMLTLGGYKNGSYVCLDRWGNDGQGGNVTFSNPYMVMFKPWMLAVGEGWRWNASVEMQVGGMSGQVMGMNYSTVSRGTYRGRDAWLVRSESGDGTTWFWIDEEKRILLLENTTTYRIELVSGLQFAD